MQTIMKGFFILFFTCRERYYEALKIANMGDVRPFVRFIAQCTLQVLEMYITNTMYLSIDGDSDIENGIINF